LRIFESGQVLSRYCDADLSHAGRRGFEPGARPEGEATGSRRSEPLLKDLVLQIFSKYFQAFASSSKIPVSNILRDIKLVNSKKFGTGGLLKPRLGVL
jgi:hypothetical protein